MFDGQHSPFHAIPSLRRPVRRVVTLATAGGFLLLVMTTAVVIGAVGADAATPCPPGQSPVAGQALKNIDTSLGCNNTSGAATNPATGWLAIRLPQGATTAAMQDIFLGGTSPYTGAYTATFTNCVGGTATPGNYHLPAIAGDVSSNWITAIPGNTIECQYTVAYTGTPPNGVTTLQNFARFANIIGAPAGIDAISPVVQTFGSPLVPEVPLVALLPVVGVLALVVFLGLRRRSRIQPPVVSQ